ncbi:MAG: DUF370 domain-containing protein [Lachnospiraceae bacterium]|nr:DUF370 domain-containing protein [Lachnospiraceae bacterium]
MDMAYINIGFGNIANDEKLVAIIAPDSAPAKRLIQNARDQGLVIDATQGRRTRAVLVTERGQVILSALVPETIAERSRKAGSLDGNSLSKDRKEQEL